MAARSPLPALADQVSSVRDEIVRRCADLRGVETPAARSEMANLREAARPCVPRFEDATGRDPRCGGDPHPARMPIGDGRP